MNELQCDRVIIGIRNEPLPLHIYHGIESVGNESKYFLEKIPWSGFKEGTPLR